MLDRKVKGIEVDVLVSDNRQSTFEVTSALIAEGKTRIGFLGGDPHVHTSAERYLGFVDAMQQHGLKIDERFVLHGGMSMKSGYTVMEKALTFEDCPDAFFVVNDMVHIGATSFLMANAPKEVRRRMVFASFDYLYYAPLLRFCHYAVSQPLDKMARLAVQLLIRRLEGDMQGFPSTTVLKPTVVVMEQTNGIGGDEEPHRHPPRFNKEFS